MSELYVYGWMFLAAVVAGSFLPFLPASSELVLAGLLAAEEGTPTMLVLSATVGNVLGSIINYFLGRYVSGLAGKSWFPASEEQMQRASAYFNRYGVWILLMSWLPALGDLFTTIAGLLRTDFKLFVVLTTIGKFMRYLVIAVGFDWFQGWLG